VIYLSCLPPRRYFRFWKENSLAYPSLIVSTWTRKPGEENAITYSQFHSEIHGLLGMRKHSFVASG
jgi:hypothetical protein